MSDDEAWNEWFNAEHYRTAEMGTGWMAACEYKNRRIAELDARLKESGRIMAQLAEAAEDDGVDGVRWRAIAGDAYDFINAPEGYADD